MARAAHRYQEPQRRTSSQRPQPSWARSAVRGTHVQAYQRQPLAPSAALMVSQRSPDARGQLGCRGGRPVGGLEHVGASDGQHMASHPDGGRALLQIAGLIHHQHRLRVAQVLSHVVADCVGVPDRPAPQVLDAIRSPVPGVLADAPAVLAGQLCQQAAHERPCPPPRLDPSEPPGDAA
jgi:hypothetical protein